MQAGVKGARVTGAMKQLGLVAAALTLAPLARAVDPATPLKRSEEVLFVLRDSTFRGKLEVKSFEVETAYGKLTVPASDVIRIRIGKRADRELKSRLEKLVADLGSKDFQIREAAHKELAKLGKIAYSELLAASRSNDTEVKERASALLSNFTLDETEELQPDDDEIVTANFIIRGTVKLDLLNVATRFGALRIEKKDIVSITLAEPEFATRTFSLTGRNTTQSNQWLDTGIQVKKGDRLIIAASGSLNWINYGNITEPGGNEGWGVWRSIGSTQIYIGALVGKIGAAGAVFLVGDKYTATATADGTLFLATAANWSGNIQVTGEYKVRIEHRPVGQ